MAKKRSKEDSLQLRKKIKSKKPDFPRDDSHKVNRVSSSWRRPKGLQAKLRLKYQHAGRFVSPGFGSPKDVRGLHPSGFVPVYVTNVQDLDALDPKVHGALVASSVGTKKRIAILQKATEKNITLLNIRDAKKFMEEATVSVKKRKEAAEKKSSLRESKKKEAEKKKQSLDKKLEGEKKDGKEDTAGKDGDKKKDAPKPQPEAVKAQPAAQPKQQAQPPKAQQKVPEQKK